MLNTTVYGTEMQANEYKFQLMSFSRHFPTDHCRIFHSENNFEFTNVRSDFQIHIQIFAQRAYDDIGILNISDHTIGLFTYVLPVRPHKIRASNTLTMAPQRGRCLGNDIWLNIRYVSYELKTNEPHRNEWIAIENK